MLHGRSLPGSRPKLPGASTAKRLNRIPSGWTEAFRQETTGFKGRFYRSAGAGEQNRSAVAKVRLGVHLGREIVGANEEGRDMERFEGFTAVYRAAFPELDVLAPEGVEEQGFLD